jgi:hypothetical protein
LIREKLQSDVTAELGIVATIDFAHAARTDGADDLVRAQSGTWA